MLLVSKTKLFCVSINDTSESKLYIIRKRNGNIHVLLWCNESIMCKYLSSNPLWIILIVPYRINSIVLNDTHVEIIKHNLQLYSMLLEN